MKESRRWHNDPEAKELWDRIDKEIAPIFERMAPGFKFTHSGVHRTDAADVFNGQPEELIIRVHLRRIPEANAIRSRPDAMSSSHAPARPSLSWRPGSSGGGA